jgi:CcmD family protein
MTRNFTQEAGNSAVDTLSQAYSDSWDGVQGAEETSAFVQFMSSNDLIFVVLGVSLIIWFVLLFFMVRVDRKVTRLEQEIEEQGSETAS